MTANLPTDARTTFVVCEGVREEVGKKVTLLGVFPDGVINVHANSLPTNIALALVYFFLDGEGLFEASMEIISPTQKPVLSESIGYVEKKIGSPMQMSLVSPVFPVQEFGTYSSRLRLNSTVYERNFEIRAAAQTQ